MPRGPGRKADAIGGGAVSLLPTTYSNFGSIFFFARYGVRSSDPARGLRAPNAVASLKEARFVVSLESLPNRRFRHTQGLRHPRDTSAAPSRFALDSVLAGCDRRRPPIRIRS